MLKFFCKFHTIMDFAIIKSRSKFILHMEQILIKLKVFFRNGYDKNVKGFL